MDAQLKRLDSNGVLQAWAIAVLASSPTGFADPVKDYDANTTLAQLLAKYDLSLGQLRDAVQGASHKTLTDVVNALLSTLTVAGVVAVSNFPATQPVSGPLTDTQLRASAVPVSVGEVEVKNDVGNPLAVSGPVTDTQLRASAVPVTLPAGIDVSDRGTRRLGRVSNPYTAPPEVIDESGNGHTGVLVGGQYSDMILSAFSPGWADMLLFDGLDRGTTATNQGIDCGPFGVGATPFTLEAKIDYRRFGTGAGANQFICGVADDSQLQVLLYINPFNSLIAQIANAVGTPIVAFCAGVSVGKHDVAMSWDGATLRCYLDGVKGTDAAAPSLSAYDGTTHFWIGRGGYTNNNGDPFGRGGINEVRLSNSARYGAGNYAPVVVQFAPDAQTLALYHLDYLYGPVNVMSQDSYGSGDLFGGQQTTSAPGQTKTFTVVNGDHVDMLWVRVDDGSGHNAIAMIDPFGGAPGAAAGWPADDGVPVPITLRTNRVKVYAAASGAKISVIGYRY